MRAFLLIQLQRFREVLLRARLDSAVRAVEKAIQKTEENIIWVEENQEQVLEWCSRAGNIRGE